MIFLLYWKHTIMFISIHTQRKYHCIFTETPHTQCNQASSQLVHSRILWKALIPVIPAAIHCCTQQEQHQISQGWQLSCTETSPKLLPTLSPAVLCSGPRPWCYGVAQLCCCRATRMGCALESLEQLLWEPMGQPVAWGLCLITSSHNVQQHHIISCCLALFGFQWFV